MLAALTLPCSNISAEKQPDLLIENYKVPQMQNQPLYPFLHWSLGSKCIYAILLSIHAAYGNGQEGLDMWNCIFDL